MLYNNGIAPVVYYIHTTHRVIIYLINNIIHIAGGRCQHRCVIAVKIVYGSTGQPEGFLHIIGYYKIKRFFPFAQVGNAAIVPLRYIPLAKKWQVDMEVALITKTLNIVFVLVQVFLWRKLLIPNQLQLIGKAAVL